MSVTNPDNFIDRKKSDNIYDNFKMVALRLMVRIQSPLRLKIVLANGQVELIELL